MPGHLHVDPSASRPQPHVDSPETHHIRHSSFLCSSLEIMGWVEWWGVLDSVHIVVSYGQSIVQGFKSLPRTEVCLEIFTQTYLSMRQGMRSPKITYMKDFR